MIRDVLAAKEDSDYGDKDVEEVQTLLRSAARDCIPKERNSFVAFQAKTGVEVSRYFCDFFGFSLCLEFGI